MSSAGFATWCLGSHGDNGGQRGTTGTGDNGGTTGDNGGRGQETQERSAQGFWAESTFLTSSNTFPVFEECLADVKEPTQLQSFKNNENNDLERVKSFFRKAVAPWKSCSHFLLFAHLISTS